jgi:hypothetical protein
VAPLHRVLDDLEGAGTEVLAAEKRAHRKRTVTRLDTLGGDGPSVPPEVARTPLGEPAPAEGGGQKELLSEPSDVTRFGQAHGGRLPVRLQQAPAPGDHLSSARG